MKMKNSLTMESFGEMFKRLSKKYEDSNIYM